MPGCIALVVIAAVLELLVLTNLISAILFPRLLDMVVRDVVEGMRWEVGVWKWEKVC